jgi:hypothetical protein
LRLMSTTPTPYAISLVLHQDDRPGWRVHLTPDSPQGGYSVAIKQAEEIARAITDILVTEIPVETEPITPFMVVRNGTTVLRAALEQELADAEAKAANIASLRRALAEMS